MKFHLNANATFEAENIDEALRKLSQHFNTHWSGNAPSIFEPGSKVEIEPSSLVAHVHANGQMFKMREGDVLRLENGMEALVTARSACTLIFTAP